MKEAIATTAAPFPVGSYPQAVRWGEVIYLSGQIALVPDPGLLVASPVADHARQALANLRNVAEAAGGDLGDVVKLTLYLTSMDDFAAVNAVYAEFFSAPLPARSTLTTLALPRGSLVEIDAVMIVG